MHLSMDAERTTRGRDRRHSWALALPAGFLLTALVCSLPHTAAAQSALCSSPQCSNPGSMCGAASICQLGVCAENCNTNTPLGCAYEFDFACLNLNPPPSSTRVPLIRYVDGRGQHFYTTTFAELGTGASGYRLDGVAGFLNRSPDRTTPLPYMRYLHVSTGTHFYTTDATELDGVGGYKFEGIIGYAPDVPAPEIPTPETINLYRYYNPGNDDHFYTINGNELGAGGSGWHYEKVQCLVFSTP